MREYRGFVYIGPEWKDFTQKIDEFFDYCAQLGRDPEDDGAWETFSEWRNNRD